jgi:hypothetical protein
MSVNPLAVVIEAQNIHRRRIRGRLSVPGKMVRSHHGAATVSEE